MLNFAKAVHYLIENSAPKNEWQEAGIYHAICSLRMQMQDEINPCYTWSEEELNSMLVDAMGE